MKAVRRTYTRSYTSSDEQATLRVEEKRFAVVETAIPRRKSCPRIRGLISTSCRSLCRARAVLKRSDPQECVVR